MANAMKASHEVIKAAFVILCDLSIAGKGSNFRDQIESAVDDIRRSINLSRRKEAQYILKGEDVAEKITSAFVLAYEGLGLYRAESDFVFSRQDIEHLGEVRSCIRMSQKRAFQCLNELKG